MNQKIRDLFIEEISTLFPNSFNLSYTEKAFIDPYMEHMFVLWQFAPSPILRHIERVVKAAEELQGALSPRNALIFDNEHFKITFAFEPYDVNMGINVGKHLSFNIIEKDRNAIQP